MTKRPPGKKGLTLLEILVAAFLTLIIVGAGLLLLHGLNRFWVAGETAIASQTRARTLISFLERLLPAALPPEGTVGRRPELVGNETTLVFWSRAGEREDRTELARIALFYRPESGTLYAAEKRQSGGDWPAELRNSDRETGQPLVFGLTRLEFAYHDGRQFLPAWDSRTGTGESDRLPRAVRVRFRFSENRNRVAGDEFETLIELKNRTDGT
ncbi:MAG TPA: hypothetical protein PKN80_04075 [bacterium]|nr:hypothetical protein [bacterium]HNS48949.1 hypothetical protein [bacterium]